MEYKNEKSVYAHRIGAISSIYTTTIEEESDRVWSLALSLAEGVHQLLQGGCALDLEEDLIIVVGNFDVEMLSLSSAFRFLRRTRASVLIGSRHFVEGELGVSSCEVGA